MTRDPGLPRGAGDRDGARHAVGLFAFVLLATSVAVPTVVGLLAVELEGDLGLDDARLGLVVSAFWAVTAVTAPLAGRWVDHRGWRLGALWGALTTATGLVLAVALVDTWTELLAVLALAGVGYAFASPTSNIVVMSLVAPGRQASVLGLKQTAPPLLMAAAGAVLPALAHARGWRTATATVLVLPVAALLLGSRLPRPRPPAASAVGASGLRTPGERRRARRALAPLVVAAGLGTFSVATLTGFAVVTLVAAGHGPVVAAGVVSVGSLVAVVARVAAGRFLDGRPASDVRPLLAVMGAAAVALLLVALGSYGLGRAPGPGPWQVLVVVGVVISLVAAWTWPALLLIGVVRGSEGAGAASGLIQLGSGIGSAVGPAVFGLLSSVGGRGWAWATMGVLTVVAASLVRRPPSPRPPGGGPTS
ncbi:MFS transporter [Nocardioides daphniae]|uniref:MFS transporter n=1 Tax=Nocardioides daphniae TaxID=402297 RepID=A0A4P7U8W3_9ACTN|nr:MFS transporter [Nocardioides daphniae]QCC76446.1 MFS transporter [Nocardioides daphniae]GGD06687.1 MFS transporter [Nocardioides daphniae]